MYRQVDLILARNYIREKKVMYTTVTSVVLCGDGLFLPE